MHHKIRLFLFPFAGGSKHSFTPWRTWFPNYVDLVPLELPGRGLRFGMPLLTSMDEIVDDYYRQVTSKTDLPFAFFGHSMGSCAAYYVTKRMLDNGLSLPTQLFLSGRTRLNSLPADPSVYALPREQFWAKISEWGGLPQEVLDSKELLDLFEPVLRADLQAVESCPNFPPFPLQVPLVVFLGNQDSNNKNSTNGWGQQTAGKMVEHRFDGGHFFIDTHLEQISKLILADLV